VIQCAKFKGDRDLSKGKEAYQKWTISYKYHNNFIVSLKINAA
jgi:hypothetical protein